MSAGQAGEWIAVIVCALDECATIGDVVRRVPGSVAGRDTRVVVVDDGSTDGTGDIAEREGAVVLRHAVNLGHGTSIRDGIAWGQREGAAYVVLLDADGQHDPGELPVVLGPILSGQADLAIGSRLLGRSDPTSPLRRLGVTFFSVVTRLTTGLWLTDTSNGYRAMRTEQAASLDLRCIKHAPAEMNIAASVRGLRIVEVPVTIVARQHGTSRMGGDLRMAVDYSVEMFKAVRRHRRAMSRAAANPVQRQAGEGEAGNRL